MNKKHLIIGAAVAMTFALWSCNSGSGGNSAQKNKKKAIDMEATGDYEVAELTAAPNVPAPVGNRGAKKLIINLETTEIEATIADTFNYTFWTFNDIVPGSFMRVREGDEIQLNLKNHESSVLPHNIDLHAVNGPGGGAEATFASPGQEASFNFKALNPGLYVYHCAAPPVPQHIGNGMYGLILVEPEGGLEPVDKEFYIMQGEFYAKPTSRDPKLLEFDNDKGNDENPTYVLFNGKKGSMLGPNVLEAKVGDKIRMFVGNGGPNLVSSFHVIGEIFDNVYTEGGTTVSHNVQTTLIPAGGATIVEFTVDVPGVYNIVDHSLSRTFNKGALGQLKVTGEDNPKVFKKN